MGLLRLISHTLRTPPAQTPGKANTSLTQQLSHSWSDSTLHLTGGKNIRHWTSSMPSHCGVPRESPYLSSHLMPGETCCPNSSPQNGEPRGFAECLGEQLLVVVLPKI